MRTTRITAGLLFFCLIIVFTQSTHAFSLLEWLGWKKEETVSQPATENKPVNPEKTEETTATPSTKENKNESGVALGAISTELNINELKLIFANLPVERRRQVLSDPALFSELVKQQLALKSVLKAIMSNNLHENVGSQFLMQKSAENTLREIYINRLISEKIPTDFPNEEQIETFYKENQEQFTVSQRVHLWQIFLPFKNEEDIESIKEQEKQADSIKSSIEKNKVDFAKAAETHSAHHPSRLNGGYMGLINVDDIIPALRERVMELKEGKLSKPIKTENGIHIVKRGSIIEAQRLSLEQSKGQIRNALRQEAVKRLRLAIVEQAEKTYPSDIDDKKIEEWRLKLRTNM